jgi:hypothetical protein
MEELMLAKVVGKYLQRLPTHTRFRLTNYWLRLKENLEMIPKRQNNLPKLKLSELSKLFAREDEELSDEYSFLSEGDQDGPEIEGDVNQEGTLFWKIRSFSVTVTDNMERAASSMP